MSFKGDFILGKWLIKGNKAPKELVEKCLSAIQKSEKEGIKSPPLLKMLYQQGAFSREEVLSIQKLWSEKKSEIKLANSSSVNIQSQQTPQSTNSADLADSTVSNEEYNNASLILAETEKVSLVGSSLICRCPECQTSNSDDSKNCYTCGAPLFRSTVSHCSYCDFVEAKGHTHCSSCGCHKITGKAGPKSRICQSCKTVLKGGQIICLSCGAAFIEKENTINKLVGISLMAIQLLGVMISLIYLNMSEFAGKNSRPTGSTVIISKGDPYEGLSARFINANIGEEEFTEAQKKLLKEAIEKVDQKNWTALLDIVEKNEDELGLHGILLLGLTFFQLNQGEELLALQKALPSHEGLRSLSAVWRLKKAKDDLDSFNGWKAYQTILPVLESGKASARQYFWGGLMAFSEQRQDEAVKWFESGLKMPQGVHQSHLFLYLINRKNRQDEAKSHLKILLEKDSNPPAMKKLVQPYLGES
jgi:energy-converting hydrogenase Eha subunit C